MRPRTVTYSKEAAFTVRLHDGPDVVFIRSVPQWVLTVEEPYGFARHILEGLVRYGVWDGPRCLHSPTNIKAVSYELSEWTDGRVD